MLFYFLSSCVLLSGIGYLFAIWKQHQIAKYILKPTPMLFIILIAFMNMDNTFGLLILIGLIFSIFGDIFLMLPKDRFLHGLISFFVAHVCYIIAFIYIGVHENIALATALFLGALALVFYFFIFAGVKKSGGTTLSLAVLLYVSVITVMAILGVSSGNPVLIAAVLLFFVSDAVLALNRFYVQFASSNYIIMTTYYSAQFLFAYSLI